VFVLWALLAACANALSSVLERRAARDAPLEDALSWRLVADLARRPVWFGGIASLTVGFGLQALALHGGQIATVEPILIVELPFTLLLGAAVFKLRLSPRDLAAALTMSAGLALLLLAGAPSGDSPGQISTWAWVLTIIAICAAGAALLSVGWRAGLGNQRAALWATAAGAGFGLAAALMKASTALLNQGVGAALSSWKPYAMVGAGVAGLYLFQNAVQAGRLIFAQPAISLTDPLVSVLLGLVLFGEHLRTGIFIPLELLGVAMIAAGTVALAHSPLISSDARPRRQ
jgi:drug/metabolite transporter (DMT)-like permease